MRLKLSFLFLAALLNTINSAEAQLDADVAIGIEKACTKPLADHRAELKKQKHLALLSADDPIIIELPYLTTLGIIEKHAEYSKTGEQKLYPDPAILACRLTSPEIDCAKRIEIEQAEHQCKQLAGSRVCITTAAQNIMDAIDACELAETDADTSAGVKNTCKSIEKNKIYRLKLFCAADPNDDTCKKENTRTLLRAYDRCRAGSLLANCATNEAISSYREIHTCEMELGSTGTCEAEVLRRKPAASTYSIRDYSHDVVFAKDKSAGVVRKNLLAAFSAARRADWAWTSKIREPSFYVRWKSDACVGNCNQDDDTKKLSPVDYRNSQDLERSAKFNKQTNYIQDYVLGNSPIQIVCVGPTDPTQFDDEFTNSGMAAVDTTVTTIASWADLASKTVVPGQVRSVGSRSTPSGTEQSSTRDNPAKASPSKFTRQLKFLKDSDQFAAADPEGVKLETEFNADGIERVGPSNFSVDIAAGLTFGATHPSAKCTQPSSAGAKCRRPSDAPGGSKRLYSIYAAYNQDQGTEKLFDKTKRVFNLDENGDIIPGEDTFAVTEKSFADGILRAGLRVDYEFMPWFSSPASKQKWTDYPPGIRPLGSKSSFLIETLTDNQFDLQAHRFEGTFTPPTGILGNLEGFRRPVKIFGTENTFAGSFNFVVDGTSYARLPQIRDVTKDEDRRDIPDFVRIGMDFDAKIKGRLPHRAFNHKANWELAYKLSHYESLSGKAADAFADEVTLKFSNLWDSETDISLTYTNEDDTITLQDREQFTLGLEFKLD